MTTQPGIKSHGEDCEQCGRHFVTWNALILHVAMAHEARPLCPYNATSTMECAKARAMAQDMRLTCSHHRGA